MSCCDFCYEQDSIPVGCVLIAEVASTLYSLFYLLIPNPLSPPVGTWDQRYLTPQKEPGTRDTLPLVDRQKPVKHYLSAASLAVGNNALILTNTLSSH